MKVTIFDNLTKLIILALISLASFFIAIYAKNLENLISIILLVFIPIVCYVFYKKTYFSLLLFIFNYKIGGLIFGRNNTHNNFLFRNNYIQFAVVTYVVVKFFYYIYLFITNYLAEKKKNITTDYCCVIENTLKKVFSNQRIINIFKYEFFIFFYFFLFWKK